MSVEMRSREEVARMIGERVRTARKARRWSQERLAREIGMSRETVRKIETGETLPEVTTMDVIARALEVPMTLLVDWATGLFLNALGAAVA